jgi:5-methylcytosine-specific restriction endonuclease McrA
MQCYYCGKEMVPSTTRRGVTRVKEAQTKDHKIPKCRGGSLAQNNTVLACAGCNEEKGQLTADEYILVLGYRKVLRLNRYYRTIVPNWVL